MQSLLVCLLCATLIAAQTDRQNVEAYLTSVYAATPASSWQNMTNSEIFAFYDALTFYYENSPDSPTWKQHYPYGREESRNYACDVCSCLHIDLALCQQRPSNNCVRWPLTTYFNMDFVLQHKTGFPPNVWFEGLTYPGEWGFPLSCTNQTLGRRVYAWHHRVWLYPHTGSGIWWNTGNTKWAFNKVHWLLENSQGTWGSTDAQMMDAMAKLTCINYQMANQTHCAYSCTDNQKTDPLFCCCHGKHGWNLGVQIGDVKRANPSFTWTDTLNAVAKMYRTGMTGQQNYQQTYPNGTFFGYRNILDDDIKILGRRLKLNSIQVIREPQYGSYHSAPDYAFEFLMHSPYNGYYNYWSDFCNDQKEELAVIDPIRNAQTAHEYITKGYLPDSTPTKRIDAFVPRPEFKALFRTKT